MIAALPMYDTPALAPANARLWALIRDALRGDGHEAPDYLTREAHDLWTIWGSPDLVLAQTCGYPYRARLFSRVTLVGTPDYGVEGCAPGQYRSVLIVRADDDRCGLGARAGSSMAVNDDLSQSGWAAPAAEAAVLGFRLRPAIRTGSHRASAESVSDGRADWAALDAVTWRLLCNEGAFPGLRVAGWTRPTPGLPLITAQNRDPRPLRSAVRRAISALSPTDKAALMLRWLCVVPPSAYRDVADPPTG